MKLLLSSTSFPRTEQDWQGVFIQHIVQALAKQSDVLLSLWAPPGPKPDNVEYVCSARESRFLGRLSEKGGIAHLLRNQRFLAVIYASFLLKYLRAAYLRNSQIQVFHVNWLQNAIPLYGIKKPKLVTVLGSDFGLLKFPGMVPVLRSIFRQSPTVIAPNAAWMIPVLDRHFGDVSDIVRVNFGIDSGWYDINRSVAIDNVWIVVLRLTKKKIGPLFDWGESVFSGSDNQLHLFGPMQESLEIPSWVNYHGAATPDELNEQWFPKARGLISLSQHDEGLPQVMLEAMAASLPVIASSISAHQDLIRHGKNGFLVDDQRSFADAVQTMADDAANNDMGNKARLHVTKHYGTWQDCAMRYLVCYNKLLRGSLVR